MIIYAASFTGREKDWGSAEAQEVWFIKQGLTGRLLSYYGISANQAESKRSFEAYVQFKKSKFIS